MRPLVRTPALPTRPLAASALLLMVLAGSCSAADDGCQKTVPGMALAKLCHELNRGGMPVTLTLQIGDPALTSITAKTGVCSPPAGQPCTVIPVVGKVPIKLFEGDKLLTSRTVCLSAAQPGQLPNEYVFQPVITSSLQVAVTGGRIAPGTCQGLDFPPPDGGMAGDGGGDGAPSEAGAAEAGAGEAGVDGGAPDTAGDAPAPADAGAPDVAADAAVAVDSAADSAAD